MTALDAGCALILWRLRYKYELVKGCASSENVFTPPVFPPYSPLLASHLPSRTQLSLSLSFHQVIIINHDLHIQSSGFSALRKILTVNHYLRSPDFQQTIVSVDIYKWLLSHSERQAPGRLVPRELN